ncbi:MAG: DUF1326 domain-containing protein [Thermodesulfobacteriota bacterium]
MADTSWQVSGDYFVTCNCDYLCPCVYTNLEAQPTKGSCTAALAFHIDEGRYGDVVLDGLNFVIAARSPGRMIEGNWSVGLILDERANQEQQQALSAIASGQAGGPMANLSPLIGQFLGAESQPIHYQKNGKSRSISIPGVLDQALEGVSSPTSPDEPLCIDNTLHPVNPRLALAKATRSHMHVFGLDWDDASGQNNGHFAPFHWQV